MAVLFSAVGSKQSLKFRKNGQAESGQDKAVALMKRQAKAHAKLGIAPAFYSVKDLVVFPQPH